MVGGKLWWFTHRVDRTPSNKDKGRYSETAYYQFDKPALELQIALAKQHNVTTVYGILPDKK
jgi:hypothetical protein